MLDEVQWQFREHLLGDVMHNFISCLSARGVGSRFFRLNVDDLFQHRFRSIGREGDVSIRMKTKDLGWISEWKAINVVQVFVETFHFRYGIRIVELEVRGE